LIECFSNFISEPDDLTEEELLAELQEEGIDLAQLEKRVARIVGKGLTDRRLAWQRKARERREEIEKILESQQPAKVAQDLKTKIKGVLKGSYGQGARSYADAYFRKKESLSEKDLESLIEDLEHLNLLEDLNKEED
jgi:hydrogenase maturation factor HypE